MSVVESEAKTAKKAPKTAAPATDKAFAFEMPKFEVPKFEMPKFDFASVPQIEVPVVFREFAEKSVAQAKAGYEKLKAAAEETTDVMEDTFETARAGMVEYNLKAIEAVKANTDAAFSFAKDLVSVKTVAEAVELQTAFARRQFEAFTAQSKDLQAVAQKVATETAEPVKAVVAKTMKDLKAA
jgi:phasin